MGKSEYVLPWFPGKGLTWDEWHAIVLGPLLAIGAVLALAFGLRYVAVAHAMAVSAVCVWARYSRRTTVLSEMWYLLATYDLAVLVYWQLLL